MFCTVAWQEIQVDFRRTWNIYYFRISFLLLENIRLSVIQNRVDYGCSSCGWYLLFCLFHTFIITIIQYIYSYPFAEASLIFFIACFAQTEKPPWGAEPRFELGPAIQQASALSTEPRCTLKSHAAPFWATLHPTEQRCTLLSHAAPWLSDAAPYWATLHPTEPRCTLLSHAAPYWATLHPDI